MRDLGNLNYLLGIKITRTPSSITFSQEHYIDEILRRFRHHESKPNRYPLQDLDYSFNEEEEPVDFPFMELLGCLMFLAVATRPDIATAVNILSQYQKRTNQKHITALKGILRYLQGSKTLGITYHKNDHPIFGASDSNFAKESNARSRSGYCIFRGGAATIFRSCVQKGTPAQSTAEAEYKAACELLLKLLWSQSFSKNLDG